MSRRLVCLCALVVTTIVALAFGAVPGHVTKMLRLGAAGPPATAPLNVSQGDERSGGGGDSGSLPVSTSSSTLRILFVGDSITQGSTANLRLAGKKRGRAHFPSNGTCSYRFPLLRLLNEHMARAGCVNDRRDASSCVNKRRVVAVGPYHSSFGGRTPSACKQVPGLLAADQTAHGAVWGVEIEEMHEGRAAARHAAMLRLVGLRGSRKGEADGMRKDGPRDWVVQYRPAIVLILLGTNDLHGAEPSTVFERLQTLVDPLLEVAGGRGEAAAGHGVAACIFKVVLSTLPHHFGSESPTISEYNGLLKRFNQTGRQPQCNASTMSLMECSPCLYLIDGAGAAFVELTRETILSVTYDSVHPNAIGEMAIAEAIFKGLLSQDILPKI